jgi:hypothetical protein
MTNVYLGRGPDLVASYGMSDFGRPLCCLRVSRAGENSV